MLVLECAALAAALPDPAAHFGFVPGDDYKLADYGQITGFYRKLAAASGRIRWERFGTTSEGRPMYVAIISSAGNLRRLDEIRQNNRRLALGQATAEQARALAASGKAVVWIDSGLHASEVAPAQQAPLLALRLLGEETPELDEIRRNVILLQVPVINPDGLDAVVAWYRRNAGTPYELAPLPALYQKYAGHDNNRDWFMLNLPETRAVTRLLYQQWFPQILYNQHQAPPMPARIFVPPYADPLNPNIPAPVMEGINLIGAAIKQRLAMEHKPGVLSYFGFDAWWNGGLRSVPAFHNIHGILTETAGFYYATPKTYDAATFPRRFANGNPTGEPTVFYERPWPGGQWRIRDAINYMLTVDMAVLSFAAREREALLHKAWAMAEFNITQGRGGSPFAYVVAAAQPNPVSSGEMLRRLAMAAVEIRRARAAFTAGGRQYPAGTYVLPAAQPFRPYLVDLMEPQKYPELRAGTTGPTKRPYDIAGWTLPMQMGVKVDRIEEPFEADLEAIQDLPTPAAHLQWTPPRARLARPRIGLYRPWLANADSGWTEWLLDTFEIPYTLLHNGDFHQGRLHDRFDTIVFASQPAVSILHGTGDGESAVPRQGGANPDPEPNSAQRPEYCGGIEIEGLARLTEFLKAGGTMVALDRATELASFFPVGIRALLPATPGAAGSGSSFYCPGSLIRIDLAPGEAATAGLPEQVVAFSSGGQAWEVTLLPEFNTGSRQVRVLARYAGSNLLASGWLSGENAVLGKPALVEARAGAGRLILFGFRPQHRGQTFGTFKLLLNALYE